MTSKIHALCDAFGNPLKCTVTAGQISDFTQAEILLENVEAQYVIADKGYDSSRIVEVIEELGAEAVIPSRSNCKRPRIYDVEMYKERNLIERLFNKMKHFRRLATRYEKLSVNFESLIYFVWAWLWIK